MGPKAIGNHPTIGQKVERIRQHLQHYLALKDIPWTVQSNINSLAPGKFEWNFRYEILKWILVTARSSITC